MGVGTSILVNAAWSSLVARLVHNQKVGRSNRPAARSPWKAAMAQLPKRLTSKGRRAPVGDAIARVCDCGRMWDQHLRREKAECLRRGLDH